MSSLVKTFRMRSGFYVTRDGNYRIVRRKVGHWPKPLWCIERWSPGELRWERLTDRTTLALARDYVALEISLSKWDE